MVFRTGSFTATTGLRLVLTRYVPSPIPPANTSTPKPIISGHWRLGGGIGIGCITEFGLRVTIASDVTARTRSVSIAYSASSPGLRPGGG